MTTFAVAYINFFDNELKMQKIEAGSSLEAMKMQMTREGDALESLAEFTSEEDLQEYAWNGDSMVAAMEI